jgi:hypothetical protein
VPRGGKRPGAGRKPELDLPNQEELFQEYRGRMQAARAARILGRDPNIRKRRAIDKEVRRKTYATKFLNPPPLEAGAEDVIWYHGKIRPEIEKLLADRDHIPNRPKISLPLKRAKGPRARIIRDLAKEYGISERAVVRYLNNFEFGT